MNDLLPPAHSPARSVDSWRRPLSSALIGLALSAATVIGFAQSTDSGRRLYDINAERGRVTGDSLDEGSRKAFKLKREGSGSPAEIVDDPVRNSRVLVFRTGPTPAGKVKDRSELEIYSGIDFGKQWALGMKVFVPERVEFSDNWHILTQCPQNGTVHPPFTLSFVKPNKIAIVSRSDADDYRVVYSGDFAKQRWVRIEVEFTMGEKGHVRMWMDGNLVADKEASFNFKEGRPRCNLKVGTYRGKTERPFEIRFDDIRLGHALSDVADR